MEEQFYTIDELAKATGVPVRNIRYYLAEGLLPSADLRGKFALYSERHRQRLLCIQRLKDAYFPLARIKELLQGSTDAQIAAIAEGDMTALPPVNVEAEASSDRATAMRESAAAYIARLRSQGTSQPSSRPAASPIASQPTQLPAEKETWEHFLLLPGIELRARVPTDPKTQEYLQQLLTYAQSLRDALSRKEKQK
jgi:DNA-binding transcriptional MerR regulator